jgi:hypothetical protein
MIMAEELDAVVQAVELNGLSDAVLTQLRAQFPGKHFTWCMDDDINNGRPVVSRAGFAVYLVNSSDHCSVLTLDMASASGYVLAEILLD